MLLELLGMNRVKEECEDFIGICTSMYNSRVPNQSGVSLLYIMLEIHHSGWEPWISCRV